jgi:hypothetical protein
VEDDSLLVGADLDQYPWRVLVEERGMFLEEGARGFPVRSGASAGSAASRPSNTRQSARLQMQPEPPSPESTKAGAVPS